MSSTDAREQLLQELEESCDDYFSGGRSNNIFDITLSSAAILTSLIATVLAGAHVQGWVVGAFAAMPAACASAQRVLDVKGRSVWYFRIAARVRSLETNLRYSDADVAETARKLAQIEEDMEREWAEVGRSGISPAARPPRAP